MSSRVCFEHTLLVLPLTSDGSTGGCHGQLAQQLNAQSFSSTSALELVSSPLLHNEAVMEIIVQVPCSDLREGNGYRIKHDRHF